MIKADIKDVNFLNVTILCSYFSSPYLLEIPNEIFMVAKLYQDLL